MTENAIAQQVVDAAYKIHTELGPGLLESVYESIPVAELSRRGLVVARQCPVPITYRGMTFEAGFRADLHVEDKVIVEIKSVAELGPIHKKQLLTCLKLSNKRLGLPINFNVYLIKDGITRLANELES